MKSLFSKNIPNHKASESLAQEIYQKYLEPQDSFTLFLEGGLGSGKTFFVREILKHFQVAESVVSPTYTLLNEYESATQKFAHFDFYRLEEKRDFFTRGFQDIAGDKNINSFVEWPERISDMAQESFGGKIFRLKISFGIGVGMRTIKLLQ